MNDREKLLQAIRNSTKRPLPKLYLKGWSQAGYTAPPANPPENSLIIELVPLEPRAGYLQAIASDDADRAGASKLERIMENLRYEKPR